VHKTTVDRYFFVLAGELVKIGLDEGLTAAEQKIVDV
jgi:hypothetical protein